MYIVFPTTVKLKRNLHEKVGNALIQTRSYTTEKNTTQQKHRFQKRFRSFMRGFISRRGK